MASGNPGPRSWIITTKCNTPFDAFEKLIENLPELGALLTPNTWPYQQYSTLLSDAEVEKMKKNPIVLNVELDQGGQVIGMS